MFRRGLGLVLQGEAGTCARATKGRGALFMSWDVLATTVYSGSIYWRIDRVQSCRIQ